MIKLSFQPVRTLWFPSQSTWPLGWQMAEIINRLNIVYSFNETDRNDNRNSN